MKKYLVENAIQNANQYAGIEPYNSMDKDNYIVDYVEANTSEEAIGFALDYLVELIVGNGFKVNRDEESITVYNEGKVVEYYYNFTATPINVKYLTYIGQDSWSRYVYEDENKKIWKLLDCCSPRKVCETRADIPYSSVGNAFDGEPDCPMKDNIIVKYR